MGVDWYKLIASNFITRYWPLVIGGWIALAVALRAIAPAWSDIAADGDLAFLPPTVPSAVGQRQLVEAFPSMSARSAMVMVIANRDAPLGLGDLAMAMDVARRLHWVAARNILDKLPETEPESDSQGNSTDNPPASLAENAQASLERNIAAESAIDNLTEAIEIEEILGRYLQSTIAEVEFLRLPDAYQLRGRLLERFGDAGQQPQAALDLDTAAIMREQQTPILATELPDWGENIQDVWSWRHPVVGHKLGSNDPHARLIHVQLGSDFTATENIETLVGLEQLMRELRNEYAPLIDPQVRTEWSGSAAVGADMLRAAASGVRMTELVTILLVLLILAVVYRAPILIAIPLTSIGLSLVVATSLIALLAREPGTNAGYGLSVFTTTRIFVVVLLFGAGTDFCLFFLARSREMLQTRPGSSRRHWQRVVASSWRSVHDALVASALTTVVGLALMWFSQFQKFQYSGPIIAISLLVTLCV
ncbi:MAG: MMPL family transporter, partial [Planctomycetales bacterium]|nr:MMPL family transporter [Planctomycetales bacterium]